MDPVLSSTLLLTTLMGVGLVFFLRAASKDRTTTVEVNSSRPHWRCLKDCAAGCSNGAGVSPMATLNVR